MTFGVILGENGYKHVNMPGARQNLGQSVQGNSTGDYSMSKSGGKCTAAGPASVTWRSVPSG